MAKYSKENALYELKELESKLLSRAEKLLREKNVDKVAGILISIDNEIYETEREARRLRLMGRLDYEVYRTLMDGYVDLQRQIIELSEKHGLEKDVRNMYSFLKIEASLANRRKVRA
jgi:hypothetical protein